MLHYNTDFTYFASHLLQKLMGIHSNAHEGQNVVGLLYHKGNVLPWKGHHSFHVKLIDPLGVFWIARSLVVSLETNMHKSGFEHG